MKFLLLLAAVVTTAIPTTGVSSAPGREAYFAKFGSICPPPDTTGGSGVGKDAATPSPVPQSQAEVINSYIAALRSGKHADDVIDQNRIPAATQTSCASALATLLRDNRCVSRPLYLLGDAEIRQAWLCNDRLSYNVFYTVVGSKITNIWSMDATKPIVVVRAPNPNAVSGLSAETLDGTWEGELAPTDSRDKFSVDRDKLVPVWLQLTIEGPDARVFVKSSDGRLQEIKPGKFKVTSELSNAAVVAINSGNDKDGTWVETWLLAVTAKDKDTLLVSLVRQVNNVNLPVTADYSKFAFTWAGDLKRK